MSVQLEVVVDAYHVSWILSMALCFSLTIVKGAQFKCCESMEKHKQSDTKRMQLAFAVPTLYLELTTAIGVIQSYVFKPGDSWPFQMTPVTNPTTQPTKREN
jgi:hypothetical protein